VFAIDEFTEFLFLVILKLLGGIELDDVLMKDTEKLLLIVEFDFKSPLNPLTSELAVKVPDEKLLLTSILEIGLIESSIT